MPKWIIDPDHSVAEFSIRYLTIAHIRGIFGKMAGVVDFDPSDPAATSVEARIDVKSILTGPVKRDEHLISADFFDAARCPEIIFKSMGAEQIGGSRFRLFGDLTMHDVTCHITLDCESAGPVKIPEAIGGETSIGFVCTTTLNREAFGMAWGLTPMQGGTMLSREVQVSLEIEADLQG